MLQVLLQDEYYEHYTARVAENSAACEHSFPIIVHVNSARIATSLVRQVEISKSKLKLLGAVFQVQ